MENRMSNRRSALGRGLGALIPGAGQASESRAGSVRGDRESQTTRSEETPDLGPKEGAPSLLPVSEIDPNPDQPRRTFNPRQLAELSSSIERHGVLQPIVVRRAGSRYELIVGERRLRATQLAGLKTIPAVLSRRGAQ